jgi:hypothetical protein
MNILFSEELADIETMLKWDNRYFYDFFFDKFNFAPSEGQYFQWHNALADKRERFIERDRIRKQTEDSLNYDLNHSGNIGRGF